MKVSSSASAAERDVVVTLPEFPDQELLAAQAVLPARLVMTVIRTKKLASIILLIDDGVFMSCLL
jgi:hypothetical protein